MMTRDYRVYVPSLPFGSVRQYIIRLPAHWSAEQVTSKVRDEFGPEADYEPEPGG